MKEWVSTHDDIVINRNKVLLGLYADQPPDKKKYDYFFQFVNSYFLGDGNNKSVEGYLA